MPVTAQEKAAIELQVLVTKRERYFQGIQQAFDLIPRLNQPGISVQFKARCNNLNRVYSEFDSVLNKILETNVVAAEEHRVTDVLAVSKVCEELFYAIRAAEASLPVATVPSTTTATIKPKLPHIPLPTFDGTYEEFDSFKALFDTLVNNQAHLSIIEKYSYLRSSLSGTALTAIQGLPFAESSYETAYQILVNRFTNKRVIASNICQKLLSVKPFTHESQLKVFLEDFNVQVEALNKINLPNVSDFIISFMALRLLDPITRQAFENQRGNDHSVPTYADVLKFVEGRIATCEVIHSSSAKMIVRPAVFTKPPVKRAMVAQTSPPLKSSESSTSSNPARDLGHSCPCCAKSHRVVECSKFGSMSVAQRYDVLKEKLLCFSCFGPHARSKCSSKFSCRHCGSKAHHTMLHHDNQANNTPASPISTPTVSLSGNIIPSILSCPSKQVLLGTAVVSIPDVFGKHHDVRVLIDPGSMINIISQSLRDRLTLKMTPSSVRISGIGSGESQPAKGTVICNVLSKCRPFSITVEAAVLPTIATNIPSVPVSHEVINKLSRVQLADPQFFNPAAVEMLIGAQCYANLMTNEPVVPGHPSLVPSMFGTLVMGECPSAYSNDCKSFFVSHSDTDMSKQLQKFWEIEELPVKMPLDPEEVMCEEHFVRTHRRDSDGVYIVRLPFRNGEAPNLGDNRASALNRFLKLEQRLEKYSNFKELYHANIEDYFNSGHMVPAQNPSNYVLTHHGVIKDSSTTKVRVVFNPAEKINPSLPSLNEAILVGPKLQNNINDIMLTFRLHKIAITADIKQMYRAIKLDPQDSKFQQILWRFDPTKPVQQYEITRVCFGVTSSPFHALRVIKQLIQDEGFKYPSAAKVLDSDMYIDDVCAGASSLSEARKLRNDLSALLSTAGFELRKWASSHPAVLDGLPQDHMETPRKFGDHETIQVLGIQWIPKDDVFCYRIQAFPECTTKRQVLSQIARTYDLPGFLGPVVIWMKILMQQIWLQGIGWDDILPDSMITQWNQFSDEMPCLQNIQIPRYILDTYIHPPELIGFSDASSSAMAANVYLRVLCSDQRVLITLIRAKTKVAPVKPVTIPRLELIASCMLAKLIESLLPLRTRLQIENIYLFTDSMVVLSWLRTPAHLLKVFVANRVVSIFNRTLPSQWFHVGTADNPADVASRGCMPTQLVRHKLWWSGPEFLYQDYALWPSHEVVAVPNLPDLKDVSTSLIGQVADGDNSVLLIERFSSFVRAKRVIAWVLRFRSNSLLAKNNRNYQVLSVAELRNAERVLVRVTQSSYFPKEVAAVRQGKPSTMFRQLTPFLLDGVLRVGGRLEHAPIPYDARHPFILPAKCHLAKLIVKHFHITTLHGGSKIVQCLVQRSFYIPRLRELVRKTIFDCTRCIRFVAQPNQPFMSDLPVSRFTQGRAFIHTGVDLAGPYSLKDGSRRNSPINKCYFAVFVCFSTKAVHLELLSSLSTDCFFAAFDRFIARRGLPSSMFSDRGTNFIGASRVLDETVQFVRSNERALCDYLVGREVKWVFNAPANPSAGGLWEAGVKSVKHHLKRLLSDRVLLYEEFCTLLARIEAILNSRPLGVPASCPIDEMCCLTPGHFLIGAPLLSRPELDVSEVPSNRVPRWELLRQVSQHFWKRWSREYLQTLIHRQKWWERLENVKVGDIVVVMVENQPPTKWPLARITALLPAQDGVVRVVSLRTSSGPLTRPVRKLLILPVLP